MNAPVIEMRGITTRFGDKVVHDNIDVTVARGEVLAIVGGSGSGKSTLLREMLMLQRPNSGSVRVLNENMTALPQDDLRALRRRMGVLFQYSALFGALTALQNVALPLKEHTRLEPDLIDEIASVKLALAGLAARTGPLYPNELSGGMRKRVGLARAISLDPELLFLDEPSSGLDPISADALDELVLQLKTALGLTIVMVTHDMDSLWRVADRVIILGEARMLASGSMKDLSQSQEPRVAAFFQGPRARAARNAHAPKNETWTQK